MKHFRLFSLLSALTCVLLLLSACSLTIINQPQTTESAKTQQTTEPVAETPTVFTDSASVIANGVLLTASSDLPLPCQSFSSDRNGSISIDAAVDSKQDLSFHMCPGFQRTTVVDGAAKGTAGQASALTITFTDLREIALAQGTYTDFTQLVRNENGTYGYDATFAVGEEGYIPGFWDIKVECGRESATLSDFVKDTLGNIFNGAAPAGSELFDYLINSQYIRSSFIAWIESRNPGVHGRDMEADWNSGMFTMNFELEPSATLDLQISLTWEWPTNTDDQPADPADALLGNWFAGVLDDQQTTQVNVNMGLETAISSVIGARLDMQLENLD